MMILERMSSSLSEFEEKFVAFTPKEIDEQ